jgi:hypothetical protein
VGAEAHAAVSPRPPNPFNTIVTRIEGHTFAVKVWALSLVQGPFLCRTKTLRITEPRAVAIRCRTARTRIRRPRAWGAS